MPTLGTQAITAAATNAGPSAVTNLGKISNLTLLATFTRVSGGTTAKVYVQTSLDSGATWYDIACFAFTTSSAVKYANISGAASIAATAPTTGTMTDDTDAHGLLGDQLRFVVTSVGTYGAGSQVKLDYQTR